MKYHFTPFKFTQEHVSVTIYSLRWILWVTSNGKSDPERLNRRVLPVWSQWLDEEAMVGP